MNKPSRSWRKKLRARIIEQIRKRDPQWAFAKRLFITGEPHHRYGRVTVLDRKVVRP